MKLSVVTITYNSKGYLQKTIDSVRSQDAADIEYIIVDGGSTDGTLEIIRENADKDSRIRWISEPDKGIADAMNKGVRMATGDVVAHLHSDDHYLPGALHRVAETFESAPSAQWVTGRARFVDENDKVLYDTEIRESYPFASICWKNIITHPSTFIRREVFDEVGFFDLGFKYAMDYDLFVRIAKRYEPVPIDEVLAVFRYHEQSLSSANLLKATREEYEISKRFMRDATLIERAFRRVTYLKDRLIIRFGLNNFLKKMKKKFQQDAGA